MPTREVEREVTGPQARRLMTLIFLWGMSEIIDAGADEDFDRALREDDWIDPLSEEVAEAFAMAALDA